MCNIFSQLWTQLESHIINVFLFRQDGKFWLTNTVDHVLDMHCILYLLNTYTSYCRDKLRVASDTSAAVFGNLEELHDFHAGVLYPELERCGANPAAVARAFVENCAELRALYSDQCRNMHSAHRCEEVNVVRIRGVTIPLFAGSESSSGIAKWLRIQ